jgi:hypothetical protein
VTAATWHRLDGLEPDNLLAFLALLGLLHALEAVDQSQGEADAMAARAAWDVGTPPVRPILSLKRALTAEEVVARAAHGIEIVAAAYGFGDRKKLDYTRDECRKLLRDEAGTATLSSRRRADLLAALMTDAGIKDDRNEVDPTPLCLLFGGGHQFFLERLSSVLREPAPPPRGRGKHARSLSASECLGEVLFQPWHRGDPATSSFRWDPAEDVRYALRAGDPTDPAYKAGTQHGANRLGAVGLAALTLVPEIRGGRVRPAVIGGKLQANRFAFAWPIWREPATLSAIRALLAHPHLRTPGALKHLSVDHVLEAQRIPSARLMNFSRARPLREAERLPWTTDLVRA